MTHLTNSVTITLPIKTRNRLRIMKAKGLFNTYEEILEQMMDSFEATHNASE